MSSLIKELRENISTWNRLNPHVGQNYKRACLSTESFMNLIAPSWSEVEKYGTNKFNRNSENDFRELSDYYKDTNNKEIIYSSLKDFLLSMGKYRVFVDNTKSTVHISLGQTLNELKEIMLHALEKETEIHKDNKKTEEMKKTIKHLNIIEDDDNDNIKYIGLWVDSIFYYIYYAVTDDLHNDMPYLNYPLKKDLEEYENYVTLKYGSSGKPGLYQVYYLANKRNNLIALYECGEHEYYGNGPSRKVNYEAAYDYYCRTIECVGNHPLALWSIAYMEFEYLNNGTPKEEYRVRQIEDYIAQYGREGLCKDILDKIGTAYMYSGSSKGAAANLLGKIMEAKEEVFPMYLKKGFYNKSARQYFEESAKEGYVYGCNNYSRICMEELQSEMKKSPKNVSYCYEKAYERKKYLEMAANLGEPWAANQYALLVQDGWGVEGKLIVQKDIQKAYELFEYGEIMGEMEHYFWPLINICNRFWLNEGESGSRQKININDIVNDIIPKLDCALELTTDKSQILELIKIRKKAHELLYKLEGTSRENIIINNLKCNENKKINWTDKETKVYEKIKLKDELHFKKQQDYWKDFIEKKELPIVTLFEGNKNGFSECYIDDSLNEDMIFDLASMTKFFLSYVYLYLDNNKEMQSKYGFQLSINKRIKDYTNDFFCEIGDLKLSDMLSYNVDIHTTGRIDDYREDEYDEAFNCLNHIVGVYSDSQIYSDMPMLVLGELLEIITGRGFGEWLDELIVEKYKLKNTFWNYKQIDGNKEIFNKLIDYGNEYKLKANGEIETFPYQKGKVHDVKARILSNGGKKLCGNAGIFASAKDICTLLNKFLNESEQVKSILMRIVLGSGWSNEAIKNSFGFGCYRKYYDIKQSEVPVLMSPYTIASSGYTGCYFALDLLNECFIFIGANRLANSISNAERLADFKEENGYIKIGEDKFKSTINYVYQRDIIRDRLALHSLLLDDK